MSIIINAKSKMSNGNVSEAFKNEAGAIDLASIMVGIIVIGLIGGVIAATVFAVIPWAQDNAAKQQLDSVASAQAAYIGLTASKGDTRFAGAAISSTTAMGVTTYSHPVGNSVTSVGSDSFVAEKLFDAGVNPKLAIGMWGTGQFGGAHYGAAIRSSSGKVFYISDAKTQPTDNSKTAADKELGAVVGKV